MATVIGNNQVKLNDGKVVAAQQGGWYDGQQFWGGTLSQAGVINAQSNQVGAGQKVSSEVNRQSDAAQGLKPGTIDNFVNKQTNQLSQTQPNTQSSSGPSPFAGGYMGSQTTQSPSLDLQRLYTENMNTPEVQQLNTQIGNLDAQINERRKALDTAMVGINDNPFYSEATRTGKLSKLQQAADRDLNTLLAEKQSYADNLSKKQAEAQVKINLATKQYDINRQEYQDQLQRLNFLIESGGIAGASGQDIAQLSVATGISPSVLDSIIKTQTTQNVKPQIFTDTDSSGNVTFTVIDTLTGNIINQSSGGAIGKGDSSSSKMSESDISVQLAQDARDGVVLKDVFQIYGPYLDANKIYQLYNTNSKYGPAQEDPYELEKFGVKISGY